MHGDRFVQNVPVFRDDEHDHDLHRSKLGDPAYDGVSSCHAQNAHQTYLQARATSRKHDLQTYRSKGEYVVCIAVYLGLVLVVE